MCSLHDNTISKKHSIENVTTTKCAVPEWSEQNEISVTLTPVAHSRTPVQCNKEEPSSLPTIWKEVPTTSSFVSSINEVKSIDDVVLNTSPIGIGNSKITSNCNTFPDTDLIPMKTKHDITTKNTSSENVPMKQINEKTTDSLREIMNLRASNRQLISRVSDISDENIILREAHEKESRIIEELLEQLKSTEHANEILSKEKTEDQKMKRDFETRAYNSTKSVIHLLDGYRISSFSNFMFMREIKSSYTKTLTEILNSKIESRKCDFREYLHMRTKSRVLKSRGVRVINNRESESNIRNEQKGRIDSLRKVCLVDQDDENGNSSLEKYRHTRTPELKGVRIAAKQSDEQLFNSTTKKTQISCSESLLTRSTERSSSCPRITRDHTKTSRGSTMHDLIDRQNPSLFILPPISKHTGNHISIKYPLRPKTQNQTSSVISDRNYSNNEDRELSYIAISVFAEIEDLFKAIDTVHDMILEDIRIIEEYLSTSEESKHEIETVPLQISTIVQRNIGDDFFVICGKLDSQIEQLRRILSLIRRPLRATSSGYSGRR